MIVWSDEATRFYGNISARGGAGGGNGGFVETSGHYLDMRGAVDTGAPMGSMGTLLLDPTNIYIASSQANATAAGMSGTDTTIGSSGPTTYTAGGTAPDSLLLTTTLTGSLASNNVIVSSANATAAGAGNITVVDPVSWTSTSYLGLSADNNISINAAVSGTNATLALVAAGGNITQTAAIAASATPSARWPAPRPASAASAMSTTAPSPSTRRPRERWAPPTAS